MNRLFLKIFFWFWATVIIIGISLVLSFVLSPRGSYMPWQNMQNIASSVVREMDTHGPAAAGDLLSRFEKSQDLQACLYDPNGNPITGNRCASFQETARKAAQQPLNIEPHSSVYRNVLRIHGKDGKSYILATEMPFGPGAVHKTLLSFVLHWILVLVVSSAICYLLTLWLTNPILRLRETAKQIAGGNLAARVGPNVEKRGDDFGNLARDFNAMAARIETLLSSQRQLISDVSHEFRSPLTRINLALDLARRRLGNGSEFDRINADLEKLNEMIGSLLTVARLDSGVVPVASDTVDLSRLVTYIAGDAELEARERPCRIACDCAGEFNVRGDEALLSSAIENIVRNAIYYTAPDTEIRVELAPTGNPASKFVQLRVSDRGPGVPEADLENIFKPFYRTAIARDRQSGGTGLGLAIASRVVDLHHGSIRAANRAGGGLEIMIQLPAA